MGPSWVPITFNICHPVIEGGLVSYSLWWSSLCYHGRRLWLSNVLLFVLFCFVLFCLLMVTWKGFFSFSFGPFSVFCDCAFASCFFSLDYACCSTRCILPALFCYSRICLLSLSVRCSYLIVPEFAKINDCTQRGGQVLGKAGRMVVTHVPTEEMSEGI